jgi:hypothetical protein
MAKLLIFNFDGTSNEPSDAVQDTDYKGTKEDDSITNVLKFHLMSGGNLLTKKSPTEYESSWPGTSQRVFYYHGVGTYGSRLKRLYNAAVSDEKSDVATILNKATEDFSKNYSTGDTLLVTGFSRGAALARRFVALIEKSDSNFASIRPFVVEAIFDTVASIGLPNMSRSDRPDSDVIFENGHSLPAIVKKALHCVSLDDKRKAFQPTLMNAQEGVVHEVWFAGAHSDVGGGYYRDRLSDLSLEYFLQWLSDNLPQLKYGKPSEQMLENIVPEGVKYAIGIDDLMRNPSPFGKNHQQDRFFIADWLTLSDRLCCVIEDDKVSPNRPLVHWSVAARINGDGDYRPKSLKNNKHTVVYADSRLKNCNGLTKHIENPRSDLRFFPEPNQLSEEITETVSVFASQLYNHSGLMLEQGKKYRFSVSPGQTWNDAKIECGPSGWNRSNQHLGLSEMVIKMLEPFRRMAKVDWFCLCGCVTDDDDFSFEIGDGPVDVVIQKSGEFMPFANDKRSHYGNNGGKIVIQVQRLT